MLVLCVPLLGVARGSVSRPLAVDAAKPATPLHSHNQIEMAVLLVKDYEDRKMKKGKLERKVEQEEPLGGAHSLDSSQP